MLHDITCYFIAIQDNEGNFFMSYTLPDHGATVEGGGRAPVSIDE